MSVQVQDLLKDYAAFRRYARNGLELELRFHWGQDLPSTELQWAFALCKANMETIYETSWGWSDADKREELTALKARFLIAFDQARQPACKCCMRCHCVPHHMQSAGQEAMCVVQVVLSMTGALHVCAPGRTIWVALPCVQDGAPQAYVHFRWEEEDGVPVLYCYEIQLESAVQRKGLGKCVLAPL